MYFLAPDERTLLVKSLLPKARQQTVAEDLRGWNWHEAPLAPAYSIKLAVYEVANSYCDSARDLWWRKVQHVREPANDAMVQGIVLHSVLSKVISTAKKLIWTLGLENIDSIVADLRNIDRDWLSNEIAQFRHFKNSEQLITKAQTVWSYEASIIEARIRESFSRQPYAREDSIINCALPIVMEQRLDGSLLGLSQHLSVDAYQSAEPLILELKFGEPQHFHKIQVTGYALVAESLYEYPFNIGCLVYASFMGDSKKTVIKKDFFVIDEELRQEFIDQRDERMRMVFEEIDPGLASNCTPICPYYKRCFPVVPLSKSVRNATT